jgi:hypothetical protein
VASDCGVDLWVDLVCADLEEGTLILEWLAVVVGIRAVNPRLPASAA